MPATPVTITAGLVVQVDTAALRALGGSETNAELGAGGDRAVTGTHDFLIVQVDAIRGVCTAVPLFPRSAVGNQPLVERLKSGAPDGWLGVDTYFSRWQHWRIPTEALISARVASGDADAPPRRYAAADSSALDDIRIWESRNRASYRPA